LTKELVLLAVGAIGAATFSPIAADPPAEVMRIVRAEDVRWRADPANPGLEVAVIEGDPTAAGKLYVVRVRFAAGTFSAPHFHPETRYVVVLKGTWWVGSGPNWDRDATAPLPAGSFVVHHAGHVHYDGAKNEEVIVQITGIGPTGLTRVDEAGRAMH
jgi:quercetin dioxygenase-like cupin family protein